RGLAVDLAELPVMVVVAEALAGRLEGRSNASQPFGETLPVAAAVAELLGRRSRAIHGLDADSVDDLQHGVGVLELGVAHVCRRHGQAGVLEALCEGSRVAELATPAFHLAVSEGLEGLEGVVERRFIASAVELVGVVHDLASGRMREATAHERWRKALN